MRRKSFTSTKDFASDTVKLLPFKAPGHVLCLHGPISVHTESLVVIHTRKEKKIVSCLGEDLT